MEIGINAKFLSVSEPGGAVKVSRKTVEKMITSHDQHEYHLYAPEIKNPIRGIDNEYVRVHSGLNIDNSVIWEQVILPYLLYNHKPDILYNPLTSAPIVCKSLPMITTIHGVEFLHGDWYSNAYSIWYYYMSQVSITVSDCVTTVSEYAKKDIKNKLDIENRKIEVVYNGVDEIFFERDYVSDGGNRKHECKPYILYVGSMSPRKNISGIVEAFKIAKTEYDLDHRLMIIGPEKQIFQTPEIEGTEDIIIKGYMDPEKLEYYYKECSVLVFPSFHETFGLPPLEAMASGKQVIVSDSSSFPEILGNLPIYVDPNSVQDIAQAIKSAIKHDGKKRSNPNERIKRARQFTWKNRSDKLERIITRVAQEAQSI